MAPNYSYARRSTTTPAQLRDYLSGKTLDQVRRAPRSKVLTPYATETEIAQTAAIALSHHVKFDEDRGKAYVFENGVWRVSELGLKRVISYLLAKQVVEDGSTSYPWIRPVFTLQGNEAKAAKKAALSSGLAIATGEGLVEAATGKPFELLRYVTISTTSELKRLETQIQYHDDVLVTSEVWDRDTRGVNTTGGWLDFESRTVEPHSPTRMSTKLIGAEYDPVTHSTGWRDYLEEVLPDQEMRAFLQRAVGYAASGMNTEQAFFALVGIGSGGKSVFADVITQVLGDYAAAVPKTLFQSQGRKEHDAQYMTLKGLRIGIVSELSASGVWEVSGIKGLTGNDVITGRYMGKEHVNFDPTHTIFVLTNHRPNVPAGEAAFWRRYYEIPFVEVFVEPGIELRPGEKRADKHLKQLLLCDCRSEVLNWILDGFDAYLREGLNPPAKVLEARETAKSTGSHLGYFMSQAVNESRGAEPLPAALLFEIWRRYKATDMDLQRVSPNSMKDASVMADEMRVRYEPARNGKGSAVIHDLELTDFAWEILGIGSSSAAFVTAGLTKAAQDYVARHRPGAK